MYYTTHYLHPQVIPRESLRTTREHLHGIYRLDLTKTFDSVDKSLLWKIMLRLGIPRTFVKVCRSLHTNNYSRVRYNEELTETFAMRTRVRD